MGLDKIKYKALLDTKSNKQDKQEGHFSMVDFNLASKFWLDMLATTHNCEKAFMLSVSTQSYNEKKIVRAYEYSMYTNFNIQLI